MEKVKLKIFLIVLGAVLIGCIVLAFFVNRPEQFNVSDEELQLMSRTVYGEARGEIYRGKVAVAAVILNRVKSDGFPSTIADVIYQPNAFTAVNDGQINLGTDEECMQACRDALKGKDPTRGCVYYYNPKTATNQWIKSRPVVVTIGRHVFCK